MSGEGPPLDSARAAALLAGQNRILRMVASGEPLSRVLDELVRFMEAQSGEALCSVLLLDQDQDGDQKGKRLHMGAAPSLPDEYNSAIDGLLVGPTTGSCGASVFCRAPVIVTDVETDPLWEHFRTLALSHGLRACTSSPILDSSGEVLGTFAFYYRTPRRPSAWDFELIELSRDLAGIAIERTRFVTRLEEAIRTRDTFLAIASHELRTPLTTLLLQTEAIRRLWRRSGSGPVPASELVPRIESLERQGMRLERLVRDLLDVSQLASGRITLERAPVDLALLAREVAADLAGAFARDGSSILLHAEGPVLAFGDRGRLEQILENLLSNALKFGGGCPAELHVERRDDRAIVRVRDRGIGIAPEDQQRIFEKYERAVSVQHYGGFGLGLWLSRGLIEEMGGRIEVESRVGEGSTFTVELEAA
ncbi:MAG TPA: GAF domain-containing sensor histidine kinase [Candidatus Nanopelagicales bacterium]|nr:GAF domain-containing sensor histidine kinase [Candidatus Nanopelagicales bacterium]